MNRQITRKELFRHHGRSKDRALRPPWARDQEFSDRCTACDACIEACPEKILTKSSDLRVRIDFSKGGCTLCGKCAEVCEPKAIHPSTTPAFPFVADIAPNCLALAGVTCRVCEEKCEEEAISFHPLVGGRSVPTVTNASCTGCGACFSVCPAKAIRFDPLELETEV